MAENGGWAACAAQRDATLSERDELLLLRAILDAYPYPVVFVDDTFTIRYLNKNACYHYYVERGYENLVGKSLFACHKDASRERIRQAWEGIKRNGKEVFVGVSSRNQRIYMQGVRGADGSWIGFFERFELNLALER